MEEAIGGHLFPEVDFKGETTSFDQLHISRNDEETMILQKIQKDFSCRLASIIEAERTRLLVSDKPDVRSSVLILPKLNPWAAFLTQQVVEELFSSLVSFSIGSDSTKRIVICNEKLIQRKVIADALKQSNADLNSVESLLTESSVIVASQKPLALDSQTVVKTKKPEKQIYVPRGKRMQKSGISKEPMLTATDEISPPSSTSFPDFTDSNEQADESVVQPEPDEYWSKLSKSHLHELLNIVGQVEILKPEWGDFGYDMQITIHSNLVEHIIEAYNFDKNFTTDDIFKVLAEFNDSGFRIKWIDDSHALLIFKNKESAAEALTVRHPVLKLRPVVVASRDSKLKIKRNSDLMLPFKERPITVPTVARRLIQSSLGLKTETTPTVLKDEEDILQRARENKLRRQQGM